MLSAAIGIALLSASAQPMAGAAPLPKTGPAREAAMAAAPLLHLAADNGSSTAIGDLVVTQAWSRATPAGAKVASGYLTIENKGGSPDRLLGGTAAVAAKVEVHEMAIKDGVMTMRMLDGGLPIAPGTTVKLAPSSYHLMLADIKQPLKQGDKVTVTLDFEKAGKKDVTFSVLGIGAKSPEKSGPEAAGPAGGAMDHGNMPMDHSKMKM